MSLTLENYDKEFFEDKNWKNLTLPIVPVNEIYYLNFGFFNDQPDLLVPYYSDGDSESENFYIPNITTRPDYLPTIENIARTILNGGGDYDVFFSDVAKLDFVETAIGSSHITVGLNTEGNLGFQGGSGYTNTEDSQKYGDVWLNGDATSSDNSYWSDMTAGSVGFLTVLHEFGHAMGLDHPFHAAGGTVSDQRFTVMSYNLVPGMRDPNNTAAASTLPSGLQLFDILALQDLYGANYGTRSGDTTYDANGAFASTRPNDSFLYTIWDGGGTDTIDAGLFDDGVVIDLRQGEFSSIGRSADSSYAGSRGTGLADQNVAVAYKAVIENAKGAVEDDVLIGNAWNNQLEGGSGADKLFGDGTVYRAFGGDSFNTTDYNGVGNNGPAAAADGSGVDTLLGGAGKAFYQSDCCRLSLIACAKFFTRIF